MCITIPSSANVKRARQWAAWRWLAESPLRLFGFAGVLFLGTALSQILWMSEGRAVWPLYNLLLLVLPTLLLGPLLTYLPVALKVTPLRYVGYGALFFVLLFTQLAYLVAGLQGTEPGFLYLLLQAVAWSLGLIFFQRMLATSFLSDLRLGWTLYFIVAAVGASGVLFGIGYRYFHGSL
jgi:hypothetical protein